MKSSYLILSVVTAALAVMGNAQAQVPSPKKITISPAHTEAHTIIGMQYFVVGTLAKNCEAALNKPETFTKEIQAQWLAQNKIFIDALTRYQGAMFAEIEATSGKEKLVAEKARFRQIVINQGTNMVDQFMSRGEKPAQCAKAETGFNIGYFDITPKFPLYPEAMALVKATGADTP